MVDICDHDVIILEDKQMTDDEIEEILEEYKDIVARTARSAYYSSASIDLSDLCQIGNLAVLTAVKTYDPSAGSTIKSYVSKIVRREIFNEAGRFLGVFTVDSRLTSLAALAHDLTAKGLSDVEIAKNLSAKSGRNIDVDHVRDLRVAYVRRYHSDVSDEILNEDIVEESSIQEILDSVISNDLEQNILDNRIMGDIPASVVAVNLNITKKKVYEIEGVLRAKLRHAIEEAI